jgi:hypothetical protein
MLIVMCQQRVTVNDDEDPKITCPADEIVDNDEGFCSAVVNFNAATAIDNCAVDMVGLTNGITSGNAFPLATTINTFTANDTSGNEGLKTFFLLFGLHKTTSFVVTCQQLVTVNDVENPKITCPVDINVDNTAGFCSATVNYDPATAIDNCAIDTVGLADGIVSGEMFPVGSTTNSFNANDTTGNNGNNFCLTLMYNHHLNFGDFVLYSFLSTICDC